MENKDKKKLLFTFAVIFILLLLVIGLLLNKLSGNKDTGDKTETKTTLKETRDSQQDGEDEDPFLKNTDKPVKVDGITFSQPTILNDATVENTIPVLLQAKGKNLLIKADGFLYFYNTETKHGESVAKDIEEATFSDDGEYIFYTRKDTLSESVYMYNVKNKYTDGIQTKSPEYGDIKNLSFHNGVLLYSYFDFYGNKYYNTNTFVIPDFATKYQPFQRETSVEKTSSAVGFYGDKAYVFDPYSSSIKWIQLGDSAVTEKTVPKKLPSGQTAKVLEFNSKGEWLLTTKNEEETQGSLVTKSGVVNGLTEVSDAKWLDDNRILVLDRTTLYLYNVEDKKSYVLATGVNEFDYDKNHIFIKNFEMKIAQIDVKKKD